MKKIPNSNANIATKFLPLIANNIDIKCLSVKQTRQGWKKNAKKFRCRFCNHGFQVKNERDIHELRHSGQKPFACTTCNKQFLTEYLLGQHHETHTDGKPFSCSICLKKFPYERSMKSHEKKHANIRAHKCEMCEKGFFGKSDSGQTHGRSLSRKALPMSRLSFYIQI